MMSTLETTMNNFQDMGSSDFEFKNVRRDALCRLSLRHRQRLHQQFKQWKIDSEEAKQMQPGELEAIRQRLKRRMAPTYHQERAKIEQTYAGISYRKEFNAKITCPRYKTLRDRQTILWLWNPNAAPPSLTNPPTHPTGVHNVFSTGLSRKWRENCMIFCGGPKAHKFRRGRSKLSR